MNEVPEKATVTQVETKSQPQARKMRWLVGPRAFLQIPNPAIVKVFILSCFTTFTSGIALALEWICHGKSHTGFKWIIYYTLFLMGLPIVILFGLPILMAIFPSSHGSSQCTETTQRTEETEEKSCQSLAVVVVSDDQKMPRIKRAVSFPSHGQVRSCRTR